MKKGIIRIIIGCILIVIQIFSVMQNLRQGFTFQLEFINFKVFLFDLLYLLGFFLVGIIGLILLFSGIYANRHKKAQKSLSKEHTSSTTETISVENEVSTERPMNVLVSEANNASVSTMIKSTDKNRNKSRPSSRRSIYISLVIIVSVLFSLSTIFNIFQHKEIDKLERQILSLETTKSIQQLEIDSLSWDLSFYETNMVLCNEVTQLYHNGECSSSKQAKFDSYFGHPDSYFFLEISTAINNGYRPCPNCY